MNKLVFACTLIASALSLPAPGGGGGYGPPIAGGYGGGAIVGGHVGGFGGPVGGLGGYGGQEYYAPAHYSFGYGVNDPYHGTNFGHSENRDGHKTQGEYFVNLPDGRLQKVTYYADEHGYHPTVTYEGKAHFPAVHGHIAPGGYH